MITNLKTRRAKRTKAEIRGRKAEISRPPPRGARLRQERQGHTMTTTTTTEHLNNLAYHHLVAGLVRPDEPGSAEAREVLKAIRLYWHAVAAATDEPRAADDATRQLLSGLFSPFLEAGHNARGLRPSRGAIHAHRVSSGACPLTNRESLSAGMCRPPADDHGQVFVRDGQPYSYCYQPYGLALEDIRGLSTYCDRHSLDVKIDGGSWWFPGRTIRLELTKIEDRP